MVKNGPYYGNRVLRVRQEHDNDKCGHRDELYYVKWITDKEYKTGIGY